MIGSRAVSRTDSDSGVGARKGARSRDSPSYSQKSMWYEKFPDADVAPAAANVPEPGAYYPARFSQKFPT